MDMLNTQIQTLIDRGALFVANHSGGKDSQAMLIRLLSIVPREQLIVVHASLGAVEWNGALELAEKQATDAGLPFIVARAYFEDGSPKTFLGKVQHQFNRRPEVPSFPSKQQRYCTGELKTGPIEREIRQYLKRENDRRDHVMPLNIVVNCIGERAQESPDRAKRAPLAFNKANSKAGREWYDWRPIHELSTVEVFATIAAAGQEPHPAYAAGNERLSCVFCIFGSKGDLARGAKARPELFAQYVEMEKRTGYTMHMSRKPLAQLVAEAAL
jgi:3'-phosphoadenosine 5'-phosphosulfate sulfotransferase (PAPS reductase)/FAD synthetase